MTTACLLALLVASAPSSAYLDARLALARGDVPAAERAVPRLPRPERAELAWRVAHALGEPARIGIAAARLCALGAARSPRACAEAELYAHPGLGPLSAQLDAERDEDAPLSPSAPFPLALADVAGVATAAAIDTGASQTVVSSALAARAGLRVTGASLEVGTAGDRVATARLAILPELAVAGVRVRNLPVLVMDLPGLDAMGISAILSPQQAFPALAVRLDLARRRLAITQGPVRAPEGAIAVPYLLAGFDLAVEARVGGGPAALFGVNTGMAHAYALAASYGGATMGRAVVEGAGAGAGTGVDTLAPEPVVLAGRTLEPRAPCFRAALERSDALTLAGQLGNGLWPDGVVVVDNAARTLVIAPAR